MSERVVRLKSTLPKGDANSLSGIANELYKNPLKVRVAIVLFGTHHTTDRPHDEVQEAHIELSRIEHIEDPEQALVLRELLRTIFQNRTGQAELPAELLADERNAFDSGSDFLRHGNGVHVSRPRLADDGFDLAERLPDVDDVDPE